MVSPRSFWPLCFIYLFFLIWESYTQQGFEITFDSQVLLLTLRAHFWSFFMDHVIPDIKPGPSACKSVHKTITLAHSDLFFYNRKHSSIYMHLKNTSTLSKTSHKPRNCRD